MGSISCHQRITQSDFEKKRWPPRSIRFPRYTTVFEIPPTCVSNSKTWGVISDRRSSSSAAVSPAGPAPTMTADFSRRLECDIVNALLVSRRPDEQYLAACNKIAREG